jgi:hypothetical protein
VLAFVDYLREQAGDVMRELAIGLHFQWIGNVHRLTLNSEVLAAR